MANENVIRPAALPVERGTPAVSEFIVIDNGVTVAKSKISDVVGAGRPLANQPEAEAGVNATKTMTPLTTKQAIDAQVPPLITTAINGLADDIAADFMAKATYDPSGVGANAFDSANTAYDNSVSGLAAEDVKSAIDEIASISAATVFVDEVASIADAPAAAGNVYLTEDNKDGLYVAIDNTGGDYDDLIAADTVGGDIVVSNGNPNLAYLRQRKDGDYIKTSEYGHNLHVAIAAASERAKLMGPDVIADVEMNWHGTRALTGSAIILPTNVNVPHGLGEGITKIDPSSLTDGQLVSFTTGQIEAGGRIIFDARANPENPIGEAYTELPAFNPISKDSMRVEFTSAHGLSVDDVFILLDNADNSWITVESRPYYKKGDRFVVKGVEGNTVWVDHKIRDAYTYSTDVRAHKQQVRKGRGGGGFTVEMYDPAVTNAQVFEIAGWKHGRFDIEILGRAAYGINFSQCYGITGQSSSFTNIGVDRGTASLYGILFSNSTCCLMEDSKAGSNWHATDMGGGAQFGNVTNYDIKFRNYRLFGSDINVAGMASMHGNSDLCGYEKCHSTQAHLSGRDPFYTDGYITNLSANTGLNRLVNASELRGGVVRLDGTTFKSDRNTGTGSTSASGMIRCVAQGDTQGEVFLSMRGVDVEAPNEQQPLVIGPFTNTTNPVSLYFSGRYVIPAATTYGCARVYGPSDGISVEASHLYIDATDLPAGIPFQSNFVGSAGPTTFKERTFKPWNEGVWTTAASATASETSGGINFRNPYPTNYTPKCWAASQSNGKGNHARAGVFSRTNSQIRPQISSGDGTNMNAASVDVAWFAK